MFFLHLPKAVEDAFERRGVSKDNILYTAKADVSKQNSYQEIYLALTPKELCVLYGKEKLVRNKQGRRGENEILYEVSDYCAFPLEKIKDVQIDRLYTVSTFILKLEAEEKTVCRLSLSSVGIFEKFKERILHTRDHLPIDDSGLKDEFKCCPICKRLYPSQERSVCPNCLTNASSLKRMLGEYRAYWKESLLILVLIAVSSVLTLITPLISSQMFYDEVLTAGGKFYGQVIQIVFLIFAVKLIASLFSSVYGILLTKVSMKVLHHLRVKIFSAMQRLSINFFLSKATGTLMTRIDDDSDWLQYFFVELIPYYIVSVITVIGLLGIMASISPILTVVILISVLLSALVLIKGLKRFQRSERRCHRTLRSLKSGITDSLGGQKVVKCFAGEQQEVSRFNRKNQFYTDVRVNNWKIASKLFPLVRFIYRTAEIVLFGLGALLAMRGHLTLGGLTSMVAFFSMAVNSMEYFIQSTDPIARSMDAASRMFEILDTEASVKESDTPVSMSQLRGDIKVDNISFEYEVGRPVIKNVSFEVKAGQMIGLVGKTGAGKSTIINLIARLYDPTQGEITIDGVNVKDISFSDLRKNIGVVTQETYLFMGTIADNIRYARPDATMLEVIAAAKAAFAHDFIVGFPEGYDTIVGNGGTQLSGGEKQRISIARAILQNPAILIFDEATAAMDTQTERNIQMAIEELRRGKTIISIAHRLSTLRDADFLAVIEDGELAEIGTHQELIHHRGAYFKLHNIQMEALKFINEDAS